MAKTAATTKYTKTAKPNDTVLKTLSKSLATQEKRTKNAEVLLRRLVSEWGKLKDARKEKLGRLGKVVESASVLLGGNN